MVLWEVAHGVSAPLSLWRVGVGESYTLGHTGNRCRVRRARLEPQSFFEIWQKTKKIWMENHVVAQIIC